MAHVKHSRRPLSSAEAAPDCEELKARLRNVGLSQRKAAPLIGVGFPYLNCILNRKLRHPGYAVRQRLDAVLRQKETQPS